MYDGVIRDLKQVRYVLDLKRNLIALEVIDQLGCSIKAENGEIQVVQNGVFIMKGIRRNGLYVLVGSSSFFWITASVSHDKTKFWSIRLAHMSEKGLKKLRKQGLLGDYVISSL